MSKETGGPAFPNAFPDGLKDEYFVAHGMTLRDYFAGEALKVGSAANQPPAYNNETRARQAYDLADAMLKARQQ